MMRTRHRTGPTLALYPFPACLIDSNNSCTLLWPLALSCEGVSILSVVINGDLVEGDWISGLKGALTSKLNAKVHFLHIETLIADL